MKRLHDRVAIVTGAASGIGAAVVQRFVQEGAWVLACGVPAPQDVGDAGLALACDVTDEAQVQAAVQAALARRGQIDILVNAAGVVAADAAAQIDDATWQRLHDVNLGGTMRTMRSVLPGMLAQRRGSIVNIASVLGLVAAAPVKEASYCAAKGGLVNLTRQLGAEWGRKGVRVNAIAPGWFASEMTQEKMFDDESGRRFIERNTPMGRPGEVEELDGALLFLAGDASTYVTGHVLAVDGGWLAR